MKDRVFVVEDSACGSLDAVELRDETAGSRVTIVPSRGALVTSFFAHGREWLFLDEETLQDRSRNVRGGIPVLFPSPGKLAGDTFTRGVESGVMKQHGFARDAAFVEIARGEHPHASFQLELTDSEATRAVFPFPFRLRLGFRLDAHHLHVRAEVTNTGTGTLPFALGYHPYFAVPQSEKQTARIATRATRAWDNKNQREIPLDHIDLAGDEVDLHLLDGDSNGAMLDTPRGLIQLGGALRKWVVWTLPGKDFVCLEPWSAPADALNSGEGLTELAPGTERVMELVLSVLLPDAARPALEELARSEQVTWKGARRAPPA